MHLRNQNIYGCFGRYPYIYLKTNKFRSESKSSVKEYNHLKKTHTKNCIDVDQYLNKRGRKSCNKKQEIQQN